MYNKVLYFLASTTLVASCGGSVPAPSQHLVDAQSAERSAREVGASEQPQAQLSLKLAQDQIAEAENAMVAGDNERADSLLIRARADAELAIAQAREESAKVGHQEAVIDSKDQATTNAMQGAVK
jgi:hypothetical protein